VVQLIARQMGDRLPGFLTTLFGCPREAVGIVILATSFSMVQV